MRSRTTIPKGVSETIIIMIGRFCAAIAAASDGGQRGNMLPIRTLIWAIRARSCSFRRAW